MPDITVHIDEEDLRAVVRTAINQVLGVDKYGDARGDFVRKVRVAAEEYIAGMDWTDRIRECAERRLGEIVESVLEQTLRKRVKDQVRRMNDEGTLFPKEE